MNGEEKSVEVLLENARTKREASPAAKPKANWLAVFGKVPDDELSREAARLGEQWRAQENLRR